MALTAAGLKSAIVAQMNSASATGTTDQGVAGSAQRDAFAGAIATAVIDYLKSNTVVTGTCPSGGGPLAAGLIT